MLPIFDNQAEIPEFEFRGFVPTQSTSASANTTLSWLMEVMPAEATVNASVRKIGSKFLCKVDVLSAQGCFHGESIDTVAQDAVDHAIADVQTTAKNWARTQIGLDGSAYLDLMTRHH